MIILLAVIAGLINGLTVKYLNSITATTNLCPGSTGLVFVGGWVKKTGSKDVRMYSMAAPSTNYPIMFLDMTTSPSYGTDCIGNSWVFLMKSYTAATGTCNKLHFYVNLQGYSLKTTCSGSVYEFESYFGTSLVNPTSFLAGSLKTDLSYYNAMWISGPNLNSAQASDTIRFALELSLGLESKFFSLQPSIFSNAMSEYLPANPFLQDSLGSNTSLVKTSNIAAKWSKGIYLNTISIGYSRNSTSLKPFAKPIGHAFTFLMVADVTVVSGGTTRLITKFTSNDIDSEKSFSHTLLLTSDGTTISVSQSFNVDTIVSDTFGAAKTVAVGTSGDTKEYIIMITLMNCTTSSSSAMITARALVFTTGISATVYDSYSTTALRFSNGSFNFDVRLGTSSTKALIKDILIGDGSMAAFPYLTSTAGLITLGLATATDANGLTLAQPFRCASGKRLNLATTTCDDCPTNCTTCEGDHGIGYCTSCISGKYLNLKDGSCLDSCAEGNGIYKSDTEPKYCSPCLIPYCKTCSAIDSCSEYLSSTKLNLIDYQINYPEKQIILRFDKALNFTRPSEKVTVTYNDDKFTSDNAAGVRASMISSIQYMIKGNDIKLKYTYNNEINCNKTIIKLLNTSTSILFYSGSSLVRLNISKELPQTNFLQPNVEAWAQMGEYGGYIFNTMLLISILILSQTIDAYFVTFSYVYLLRMMNVVYSAQMHALLDGFLGTAGWPFQNMFDYIIPDTTCTSVPLKVKESYFNCVSLKNLEILLLTLMYLIFCKAVIMLMRLCVKDQKEGRFFNFVRKADKRLAKHFFIRILSSNLLHLSLFSSFGLWNDISNGSDMDIYSVAINGFVAFMTLLMLSLFIASNVKTWKVMNKPTEEFDKHIKHSLFLVMIGVEFKVKRQCFFIFSIKKIQLTIFGTVAYLLYYYPMPQVAVIAGLQLAYCILIVVVQPYVSMFKFISECLLQGSLLILLLGDLIIVPDFDLLTYSTFNVTGTIQGVILSLMVLLVAFLVLGELLLQGWKTFKEWRKNRKPSEKKIKTDVVNFY